MEACDEAEPEIRGIDPFFKIRFINADSINSLNIIIDEIDTRVDIIDDSLALLDTLNNGTDFTEDITRLTIEKALINSEKSEFNRTISLIETGSVVVNSITSTSGIDAKIPGIDSTTLFSVPLNPAADFSDFEISLGGKLFDLQTKYTRNTVTKERTVIVEALDLELSSTLFESLLLEYEDTLSNNSIDAVVTAYF